MRFLLTRLMRGVTLLQAVKEQPPIFLLTRLMRGVTAETLINNKCTIISTHTPHARRDIRSGTPLFLLRISTHTPHARRDRNI